MDFHSLISLGLDKTLRCFVCKNYLSYLPISLCSNNQSLCGRCAVPEGLVSFQEEALETICQLIKFPCRYQSDGCFKEFAPRDMSEHEKNCSCRTVQCIISKPLECNWKGPLPFLLPHCRNEHSDLTLKNGEFNLDSSVSDDCDSLLEHNDVLFIFTKRFDSTSGILKCALYNNEYAADTATCSAQLSIKNGNRTLILDLKATGFTEIIFSKLSLHCMKNDDEQDSFLCQINIGNTQNGEHRLERVTTSATILSVLKCSICSEVALPPIYRCMENMNTICSDCRDKHPSSCSICSQSSASQKSDTALEEIASLAEYPCKYQKNGCKSTLEYRQMKLHYDVCDYGNRECPFFKQGTCEWKGLKTDVHDHVLSCHQDLLVNSFDELELSPNNNSVDIKIKLIQFSNCLFRLIYYTNGELYVWFVQTIGSYEEEFKFEIDLVDGSNSGRRMSWRKCCGKMTEISSALCATKSQICDFFIYKDKVAVVKFHVNMFR